MRCEHALMPAQAINSDVRQLDRMAATPLPNWDAELGVHSSPRMPGRRYARRNSMAIRAGRGWNTAERAELAGVTGRVWPVGMHCGERFFLVRTFL